MNYGMMVSNLTLSHGDNRTESKAPPKNPDKSFGNWYAAEKAKSYVDRTYRDNENTQKLRTREETRQDDTKDYLKVNQNSENDRNDKIKRDKYKEDDEKNQRIGKGEKTQENDKIEESNEIEESNKTQENNPEENKKCEKESEKETVNKDDQKNSKEKIDKDVEEVLTKVAQLMGMKTEELKVELGLQNLNTDKGNELKIDEVIKKLSGLIDGKGTGNEPFLKQIKGLLEELDVKISMNSENNEEQNKKGLKTEKIENEAIQISKASGINTGADVENKKPIVTQEKKINTKSTDADTEAINTENKSVKQKPTGAEQRNSSNDNLETESENSGLKEKAKIETQNVEKSENSFKVSEQNLIQPSKETNDAKTEQMGLDSKITNKTTRDEIIKQFIDKASVSITEDKTEMVLNLKPDHLGKISLKVATENGIVTAQMVAENQQVKEIIETNLNVLKDALEKQGITVQQFSVSVGQDSWKRAFDKDESKKSQNSNNKKQGDRVSMVSGSGYLGGQQTINNQIWPDSTINFIA